jgi:hypothetical protein
MNHKTKVSYYKDLKEGCWYAAQNGYYTLRRTGNLLSYLCLREETSEFRTLISYKYKNTDSYTFGNYTFSKLIKLNPKLSIPVGFYNTVSPRGYEI